MKILILTQYYPPETGAPQNRLSSLAKYLVKLDNEVEVLTAMPNYPKMRIFEGYQNKFYCKETVEDIAVHRTWIYVKNSKEIVSRLLNYFSFVFTSFLAGIFKLKKYDLIICESPPLFLGLTSVWLKWIMGSQLCFNVSDLWPESAEKLGIVTNKKMLSAATWLEHWCYRNSDLISGQTNGICRSIASRFPDKRIFWLRNGFDFGQYIPVSASNFRVSNNLAFDQFIVLYAGVIGHAQGLDVILRAANILPNVQFVLVGDGPEKEKLKQLESELNLSNVLFLPNTPKSEIPSIIAACNAYVVPLKKLDIFLGAIPSKIFEPLALGCPVIMGVDGEAKEIFLEEGKCVLHFEPENYVQLAEKISTLKSNRNLQTSMVENGRLFVKQKFDREIIAKEFNDFLIT